MAIIIMIIIIIIIIIILILILILILIIVILKTYITCKTRLELFLQLFFLQSVFAS